MKPASIPVRSRDVLDTVNITEEIERIVRESGITSGTCTVFAPHTTAAVTVNENADPDVQSDMLLGLSKMIPRDNYRHFEHNSPAHMLSSLVGCSVTLLVEDGKLLLGTWQGIFFCEFDGPRNREVRVKVIEG